MSYQSLILERRGHVAVATLNRPDRLNALDGGLRRESLELADEILGDDAVWALVITGAGRGFCSGADLSGPLPPPAEAQGAILDEMGWVGRQALAFYQLDKPVIAAVNGVAAGAGMSLALACDLRVGGPTARFKTVFLERSLSPDSGMSFFLPRIVGYSRAADLIFTSRDVDAAEAYRIGLLDRLVDDDPVEAAVALAEQICALPPVAMRSAKRVLQHNLEAELTEALRYETAGLGFARKARNDVAESMASFREKRPPRFTGT
ncbi:MAG TPA: enoyl-CoA hydratase/isomerase family protein [Acidimicrobiales bacterium]|nr:enoyl-CoA hydratase/isomerase family protein [Acidimicrobiales bacterium]